ncbi:ATP-citrate synthase beta chain protein 1-like isoform X2 [Vigna radiata var. radiata]|uniref:ATP-citrate synthase beta chain protein 1-like isoform X2 n=1 Tax=Vigna radiata var. radiata TaxID=3916 RepID=A0A1S3VN88_VIGRR|nr:ATP-citrate synthase beta chain protein 1-like isoform X2 [Vigna radiata var. radiata]
MLLLRGLTARAGKDLVSCLVSGLLTIGPRFGGANDDAVWYSKDAYDRYEKEGHPCSWNRAQNRDNKDKRVELLQKFALTFSICGNTWSMLLKLKTTPSPRQIIVLNVDGAIGSLFLDLLAGSGMFTKEEVDEIVGIGYLYELFVLARSIGLIGHTFDQKRLKRPSTGRCSVHKNEGFCIAERTLLCFT